MSHELLPYTVKPHPITAMYSGKLGTWLFLASEVMLFGALFSTYILLRGSSNPGTFDHHSTHLNTWIGLINTFVLIVSSVCMVYAWVELHNRNLAKARMYLLATLGCAVFFLVVKILFEYIPKLQAGHGPSHNTFFACYFTMTGLHALHIVGGIVVIGYLWGPGSKLYHSNPEYYTNRIECAGLYWHFVDIVWIFLFPVLYLL